MWCSKAGTSLHRLLVMTDFMCCYCISGYSCNIDDILITAWEKFVFLYTD